MKAIFVREALAAAVAAVGPAVPSRTPKACLMSVLLTVVEDGTAEVLASDLEISIRVALDGVRVERPGSVLIDHRRFAEILAAGDDEDLIVEVGGDRVHITGQRSRHRLVTGDPGQFPAVVPCDFGGALSVTAADLSRAIRRTIFAAVREGDGTAMYGGTRYGLGGCAFEWRDGEGLEVRALDGHVAARCTVPCNPDDGGSLPKPQILPARSLKWAEARARHRDPCEPILIAFGGSGAASAPTWAAIRIGPDQLRTRLCEGRVPPFPPHGGAVLRVPVGVGPLRTAVERAAVTTGEMTRGVRFGFGPGVLRLRSESPDVGDSDVELTLDGECPEMSISLDPKFVLMALRCLEPEDIVEVRAISPKDPFCLQVDGWTYLAMPLNF